MLSKAVHQLGGSVCGAAVVFRFFAGGCAAAQQRRAPAMLKF